MSERQKDIFAVLILLIVVVIRFSPFVFAGKPINTDSWKRIYPWRAEYSQQSIISTDYDYNSEYDTWHRFVKSEIAEGRFPHWNPYAFCGAPLYANHLVPIFHVPFAMSLLWPTDLACTAYSFLMAIIGILFFYWFLRNWKFSVFVALFGTLIYFLSGIQLYIITTEVATLIWIPAILLFHDRFLESGRMSDACWGAFFLGQLLIASYPVYIAHFFYFCLAYAIWRRFHPAFKWNIPVRRWVFGVLVILVAGVLFSGIQNYPTYKYMIVSNRTATREKSSFRPFEKIVAEKQEELERPGTASTKMDMLLFLLAKRSMIMNPQYHTDLSNSRNYVGALVVLLSLIGLFFGDRSWRVIKVFFVLFAILVIVSPTYHFLAKIVPGWSISQVLPKPVFYFTMFLLATLGLDFLIKLKKPSKAIIALSVFVILLSAAFTLLPTVRSFQTDTEVFRWNKSLDSITQWSVLIISWLLIMVIIIRSLGVKLSGQICVFGMVLFIASGMLAQFYLFPYFADKNPMPLNEEMKSIASICSSGRIAAFSTHDPHLSGYEMIDYILLPNLPTRFGIYDVNGYDSLILSDYVRFYEAVAPGNIIRGRGMFSVSDLKTLNPNGLFIQATGTKYILEKNEVGFENLFGQPVFSKSMQIFDINSIQYPFARFVDSYLLESEYVGDYKSDDFRNKILVNKMPTLPDGKELPSGDGSFIDSSSIEMTRTSSSMKIEFDAPCDCLLYVSEAFDPNWRAKLDGKEVEILKANIAFRAVAVPAGRHTLIMWFDGKTVVVGGLISALGLALCLILALWDRKKPYLKQNP